MNRTLIAVALLVPVAMPVASLAALQRPPPQQPARLTAQRQEAQTTLATSSVVVPLRCVMRQTYPLKVCPGATPAGNFRVGGSAELGLNHAAISISHLRNMYAPSVLTVNGTKRMWLGGWLTESDPADFLTAVRQGRDLTSIPGADKIFLSEFSDSGWSRPTRVFAPNGYHVNDPSVIQPPSMPGIDRSNVLYLYYTALDNRIATDATAQVQDNVIGLASSGDGGRTWRNRGILIAKNEGGDGYGAWAPSAVTVGDEIWVYYHTGSPDFCQPITFRQKFYADGVEKKGRPERLRFPEGVRFEAGHGATLLSNLDVARDGSRFVMVANTTDLKNVASFTSTDGLTWYTAQSDPIMIRGGTAGVEAPHQEFPSADRLRVYVGFAPNGAASQSIVTWDFSLPSSLQRSPTSSPPSQASSGGCRQQSSKTRSRPSTRRTTSAAMGSSFSSSPTNWGGADIKRSSTARTPTASSLAESPNPTTGSNPA